jgi:hypothetical protein
MAKWNVSGVSQVNLTLEADSLKLELQSKLLGLYDKEGKRIAAFVSAPGVGVWRQDAETK